MQNNISKNLSYREAVHSATANRLNIDNAPTAGILETMKLTAARVFQPVRDYFGLPVPVTSFFRCKELNNAVGGSPTSQHVKGEAIDMDVQGMGNGLTNREIFDWIKDNLEFDQLINEYGYSWVHVSYSKPGNRNQILNIG